MDIRVNVRESRQIATLFTEEDGIYHFDHSKYRIVGRADPDIAGIGITCAFLITAYMVFIWMLVAYLFGWLPHTLLGTVDRRVFGRAGTRMIPQPWWQKAIDKAVLGYADQQVIYGISILVAGFIQWGSISVYHYNVVIYLGWMSSNTHLSAVTLLPWMFDDAKRHIVRMLRLFGMAVVAIMLVGALVPTTKRFWFLTAFNWSDLPSGVPAHCFWKSEYAGTFEKDSLWSFLIVIASCMFKGAQLFGLSRQAKGVSFVLLRWVAGVIDGVLGRLEEKHDGRLWLLVQYKLAVHLYVLIWFIAELSKSVTVSLWMCGAGLVWGTLKLLLVRRFIGGETLKLENSWGFGQSLALLLLAIPLVSFVEAFSDERHKGQKVKKAATHIKTLLTYPHKPSRRNSQHLKPPPPTPELLPPEVDLETLLEANSTASASSSAFPELIFPKHPTSSFLTNEDIYSYHFTRGMFWVAQLCAAWVVFLFDVLYYIFELKYDAVELSEAGFPKGEHSRMVIYGAGGTVGVIAVWFWGGMLLSGLFRPKGITKGVRKMEVYDGT